MNVPSCAYLPGVSYAVVLSPGVGELLALLMICLEATHRGQLVQLATLAEIQSVEVVGHTGLQRVNAQLQSGTMCYTSTLLEVTTWTIVLDLHELSTLDTSPSIG